MEINSTFFALPKVATLEQWADQVPEQFQFAFKASKYITHAKPLLDKADAVSRLCDIVGTLKDRCGPILFQFQESFKKDLPRLQAFLEALPAVRTAFEFRHASWFDNEVFASLRDRNAALCVADADDELVVPFVATADWGYLRLRREDYDDASLNEWLSRIRGQKWSEAFVYYKHEDVAIDRHLCNFAF